MMLERNTDMTNKQIKEIRKILPPNYDLWTKDDRKLDEELSCRELINLCLTYEKDFFNLKYGKDYIAKFGKQKVKELYEEQLEYFNNCIVVSNDSTNVNSMPYYKFIIEPEEDNYIHCKIVDEPRFNVVDNTNETYFSIKLKDKFGNLFNIALSPNVTNDYREYCVGRDIGIKVKKTKIGIYKAIDVKFFQNEIKLDNLNYL